MNPILKMILAVLGGLISAIAAALLLWPVVQLVFDKFFEFGSSRSDIILRLSFYLWVLIPTLVGGFVCSLIAARKELNHVLVLTLLTIAIMIVIFREDIVTIEPRDTLIILMFPLGYFTGGRIGMTYKRKRKKRLEKTIS